MRIHLPSCIFLTAGIGSALAVAGCLSGYVAPTSAESADAGPGGGPASPGSLDGASDDSSLPSQDAAFDATVRANDSSTTDSSASDATASGTGGDSGPPASGSLLWARQFGVMGSWEGREAVALDTNGIIATGTFIGTINVGGSDLISAGGNDVVIARYAKADGSHIASTSYGGPGNEYPIAAAVASNGVVFVQGIFTGGNANLGGSTFTWGGTGNNIFMAEYTNMLLPKWSRAIVSADDDQPGHTVDFDTGGLVYTSGKFRLTTDFGGGSVTANGDSDGFYARYDQNNNLNSYLPLADPGYQYSEAAINNLGTVVVGGDFEPSINLGGTDYATDGGMAAFVSGFSATTRLWTFTVVGPGVESDVRLASDSSGNVYVAGTFQQSITIGGKTLTSAGGSDIFLVGLSPNGAVNWVRSFGGAGNDIAWRLASSPNGDLAIAGDFFATVDFGGGARTSAGGRDIFIATFRGSDGSYRWDHTYGGAIDDFGQSVVVDTDGSVFALATFGSTVSFGTHMFNPSAGDSALLHFAK